MDFSRAHAPVADRSLLTHTVLYTRRLCFVLAYELAQILEHWTVAETESEDGSSACHVFIVREDQTMPSGFVALDIQGLHDAQDLTDQFMADDWYPVDAEEMLSEWTKDFDEDGDTISDDVHEQAREIAQTLVEHLTEELHQYSRQVTVT